MCRMPGWVVDGGVGKTTMASTSQLMLCWQMTGTWLPVRGNNYIVDSKVSNVVAEKQLLLICLVQTLNPAETTVLIRDYLN